MGQVAGRKGVCDKINMATDRTLYIAEITDVERDINTGTFIMKGLGYVIENENVRQTDVTVKVDIKKLPEAIKAVDSEKSAYGMCGRDRDDAYHTEKPV